MFIPNGGILGFGLQHSYPITGCEFESKPRQMLKGVDATVYAARELGLFITIDTVFNEEDMTLIGTDFQSNGEKSL